MVFVSLVDIKVEKFDCLHWTSRHPMPGNVSSE